MLGILGKKIGMTQVYDDNGSLLPVTVVQAGPCDVLQVKTTDSSDGYDAIQIGFGDVKTHRATKPQIGHAAVANCKPKAFVRELRMEASSGEYEPGQQITVEAFEEIGYVDVMGTTKGKGFAGGMKRHNFKGQLASHGVERKHRSPGSIASHSSNAGTGPKIKKGKRMAGQLGNISCTSRNHKLVKVDKDNNLLLIKGSVPGPNGGFVLVKESKTAKK
ncbi:MAG: 50S ribosomal protein L3 [Phycisphaerae bacterium]